MPRSIILPNAQPRFRRSCRGPSTITSTFVAMEPFAFSAANTTATPTVSAIRLVTSKLRRLCLENKIHFPGLAERFLFSVRRQLS
jgi:hypothetical protein